MSIFLDKRINFLHKGCYDYSECLGLVSAQVFFHLLEIFGYVAKMGFSNTLLEFLLQDVFVKYVTIYATKIRGSKNLGCFLLSHIYCRMTFLFPVREPIRSYVNFSHVNLAFIIREHRLQTTGRSKIHKHWIPMQRKSNHRCLTELSIRTCWPKMNWLKVIN